MSDLQLDATRTVVAWLRHMNRGEFDAAKDLLLGTVTDQDQLDMFLRAIGDFTLGALKANDVMAHAVARIAGQEYTGSVDGMLSDAANKLATAERLSDVL